MKRIKKWITVLPILLVTAVLGLSPVTAMAADEETVAGNSAYPDTGSLAIVAPRIAEVNQQISMTVFLRWNQEPFEGAGVWVFTREQADILREEVRQLSQDNTTAIEDKDYEALASVHGTFIGTTGADGKLYYSFADRGVYVLAAVKRGYFPGFTSILVGSRPAALAIDAPQKAAVDEMVTMTVTQKDTGGVVEGAGIWAITREKVEALNTEIKSLRENAEIAVEDIDFESLADIYGEFLGRTDLNGQLSHAFSVEDTYLLLSVKRGYIPGRTVIRIGEPTIRVLAIDAPRRAVIGDEVIMTVNDRSTAEPVAGAGVWALSIDKMESLRSDMQALREDSNIAAEDKNYESLMDIYGEFLGRTNESGQLAHAFNAEGGYLLVTVMQGYIPGWTGIRIVAQPDADGLQKDLRPFNQGDNVTGLRPNLQKSSQIETEINQY